MPKPGLPVVSLSNRAICCGDNLEQLVKLREAKCFYELDRYLFHQVTKRFEKEGTLTSFDFYAIITWKANRAKTKVRLGLEAAGISPTALMKRVHDTTSDREKMKALERVPGIGIPIASAILTVCYPTRFTVIDYRAWESLLEFQCVSSKTIPAGVEGYFDRYLPACVKLASEMRLSLRDLDLALWGWSQRKSIEKLVATCARVER